MSWGFWLLIGGGVSLAAALFWAAFIRVGQNTRQPTDDELQAYLDSLRAPKEQP